MRCDTPAHHDVERVLLRSSLIEGVSRLIGEAVSALFSRLHYSRFSFSHIHECITLSPAESSICDMSGLGRKRIFETVINLPVRTRA